MPSCRVLCRVKCQVKNLHARMLRNRGQSEKSWFFPVLYGIQTAVQIEPGTLPPPDDDAHIYIHVFAGDGISDGVNQL